MKFILNENKKFKLEERFILVEADEDDPNSDETEQETTTSNNIETTEEDGTNWGSGWDDLYEACKKATNPQDAFNKFWDGGLPTDPEDNPTKLPVVSNEESKGYYEAVWGKNAAFIRSLTPFVEEILNFGFTEDKNPFIQYLNLILKKGQKLTKEAYTYIHNGYVKNLLTIKDLRGQGSFEEEHLIFQPGFTSLTLHGLDYLEAQKTIIQNENNFGVANPNIKNILFNILSYNGNVKDLNSDFSGNLQTLRNIKEVENIIKEYTGEVKQSVATDAEVEDLVNRFKKDAKKILTYLTNKYRNSAAFKKLESDLLQKIKLNKSQTITTFEEDEAYDKAFNKKFSGEQLLVLFTEFAKAAKFI